MSVNKFSKKEGVLMRRSQKRKNLLRASSTIGFKRPEGFEHKAQVEEVVKSEVILEEEVAEANEVEETAKEE